MAQLVARYLGVVEAVGSSPATRTTSPQAMYRLRRLFLKVTGALTPLRLLFRKRPRTSEQRLIAPFPLRAKTGAERGCSSFQHQSMRFDVGLEMQQFRHCCSARAPSRRSAVAANLLRVRGGEDRLKFKRKCLNFNRFFLYNQLAYELPYHSDRSFNFT